MKQILDIALKCRLPISDVNEIEEYLEYNENGLAFEILCSALEEKRERISTETYILIVTIGTQMGMDSQLWSKILCSS